MVDLTAPGAVELGLAAEQPACLRLPTDDVVEIVERPRQRFHNIGRDAPQSSPRLIVQAHERQPLVDPFSLHGSPSVACRGRLRQF